MCVIIKRNPDIIIPEEKIWSACKVNPDGFGISVIDRGRMITEKIHKSTGNDSNEVLRMLDEAKDLPLFLHLRYTTAGKTNEENCHPFTVFDGDNFNVQFMHNGTLSKFSKGRDDDHSDTWHFTEEILKPLVRAFYEVDGAGVLLNPVLKKILTEFQGGSVFTLYDNEGNSLLIENTSCKQFEGWWASNTYSFNERHREPTSTTYHNGYYNRDYDDWPPYTGGTCRQISYSPTKGATPVKDDGKSTLAKAVNTALDAATKTEAKAIGYAIMQAKKLNVPAKPLTPPENRLTFIELAEIQNMTDVFFMTEGDLYDLITEKPLAATALMMDLIHEYYVNLKKLEANKTKVVPISGKALNQMAG